MCHHFCPIFGAGRVPRYVLNSKDQNFTCQRASSSATSECPWLQLPLRSWTSSSQHSSWRWGSVWKGSFCPTGEETPTLHLYTCFSEHVAVGGMKCHSLGVLYMSYKFTLFQESFMIFIAVNCTKWGCEKHRAASLSSSALRVCGVITHTLSFVFHA